MSKLINKVDNRLEYIDILTAEEIEEARQFLEKLQYEVNQFERELSKTMSSSTIAYRYKIGEFLDKQIRENNISSKERIYVWNEIRDLTESDIDRMVKEAEANADEDKKKKEEAEVKNNANSLITAVERLFKDFEGKISDSDKSKLEEQKKALEEALNTNKPADEIKKLSEELQQTIYAVSEAAYKATQGGEAQSESAQEQQSTENTSNGSDDDVIDAEYTQE